MRSVLFLGWVVAACAAVVGLACSSSGSSDTPVSSVDAGEPDADAVEAGPSPLVAARPYQLRVPKTYDASKAAPLVIALHGYGKGDDAKSIEKWMQLAPEADKRGFLYATPSGTEDKFGYPAWNATDACCAFDDRKIDDVAYLAAVIDDIARLYTLDTERVYVTGISGGAIMAHRLACDLSDRLAAIVSVSGTTWKDASRCTPTSGVNIVEMHGDKDDVVAYDGSGPAGQIPVSIPSAHDTVAMWAGLNGCTGTLGALASIDLESSVAGDETKMERYGGCARGDVELWTAVGGPHAPLFSKTFVPTLFNYFEAHPRN